jgi:general L-amino acid transport system permease protein
VGIVGGFPLGLALALGRTSTAKIPIARWLAVAYIETIRGVPLITVLFFSMYLLPLFLPQGFGSMSEVGRAAVAIVLFEAAYIAEVLRGGLAAVDKGQSEAAKALGLNGLQRLRLVVLPQALRVSAPALVSTTIGLIKDTSLVAIIGLFDLLGTARNVPSIPRWLGHDLEPLVFAGLVYVIICLVLERVAKRMEHKNTMAKD